MCCKLAENNFEESITNLTRPQCKHKYRIPRKITHNYDNLVQAIVYRMVLLLLSPINWECEIKSYSVEYTTQMHMQLRFALHSTIRGKKIWRTHITSGQTPVQRILNTSKGDTCGLWILSSTRQNKVNLNFKIRLNMFGGIEN